MTRRTFLGTLRLALLLAVLAFVALGAWLDRSRSTDWDTPRRVTVYPVADGGDAATRGYVANLADEDFGAISRFLAENTITRPNKTRKMVATSRGKSTPNCKPPMLRFLFTDVWFIAVI